LTRLTKPEILNCFRIAVRNNVPMNPIESKTLRLEPLTVAHAEEMFEPLSAPALYDYTPGAPPASAAALRERYLTLERGHSADGRQLWLNWIIRLASGRCVGFVQATIYPERTGDFAFVLAPEYWGRGVAFEACRAAIPYIADELGVTMLFATVDPKNTRSIRLLTRIGFNEVAPALYPHGEVEPNDRVFSFSC
jgi:RimJ/RimL family protein N-acetyltransferase